MPHIPDRHIRPYDQERNDTVFQKTLGVNDFCSAGNGQEWPLGNIQMIGKSNAMAMKGEAQAGPEAEPGERRLPSIGAVNPALTGMANAIRVGDHLLNRMA